MTIDINAIKPSELLGEKFQKDLEKEAQRIILHLEEKDAMTLAENLEKALFSLEKDSEERQEYQSLVAKLRFVALPRLPIKDIAILFKNHLVDVLEDSDIPVFDRLKLALISIDPWSRDEIKKQLRAALKENIQALFKYKEISQGKAITIGDSLRNYDNVLGTELVEKIKQSEYIFKNFSKLNSSQQETLKKLFNIYEYLKISSRSPRGFEDDFLFMDEKGVIHTIQRNRLIPAPEPEKEKLTVEELEYIKEEVLPGIKDSKERKAFIHAAGLENILKKEEFFSEKELKELKKAEGPPPIDLNTAIDSAIEGAGFATEDEVLKTRFSNIAKSYFGDIRSEIETRIILKRDTKVGGMGLNDETADKVINIFKKEKPQVTIEEPVETPGVKPNELKTPGVKQDVFKPTPGVSKLETPDVGKETDTGLAQRLKPPEDLILAETRMASAPPSPLEKEPEPAVMAKPKKITKPPEPKPVPAPKPAPPASEKKVEPTKFETPGVKQDVFKPTPGVSKLETPDVGKDISKETIPLAPSVVPPIIPPAPDVSAVAPTGAKEEVKKPVPAPRAADKPARPAGGSVAEEIRVKPRAQGPIDELRTLSLADWRRWGSTDQAVQKIQDKINLLAEESLTKKAESIKAWKESEINKLYLEIGEESINQGKSVEGIIKIRQSEKRPTLTQGEFDAVVELNQKLRF